MGTHQHKKDGKTLKIAPPLGTHGVRKADMESIEMV